MHGQCKNFLRKLPIIYLHVDICVGGIMMRYDWMHVLLLGFSRKLVRYFTRFNRKEEVIHCKRRDK